MKPRSLADVAAVVAGTLSNVPPTGAAQVRGVCIDSRHASPGDLFVAIAGDRTDGHRFVADAFARGAAGALVSRALDTQLGDGALVRVADTVAALGVLAASERRAMDAAVIGVTGSTGKTSTKDLIAAVMRSSRRTSASPASFNNEVGLPLTLLDAPGDAEAIVCEMGARGTGHIRFLCDIAQPTMGVVTNVGVAHMELFGSREAIVNAKAELVEALPSGGVAFLNADDPVARGYRERTAARVVTYGRDAAADVRAEAVTLDDRARATFELVLPEGHARVSLGIVGEHMVAGALAAAAVGWSMGLSANEIVPALAAARVSGGRMELLETVDGVTVLHDAYNANPTSAAAALATARRVAAERRWVAILGEMAELGPIALEEHERLGKQAARLGVDVLIAVGPWGKAVVAGAEREGIDPGRVVSSDDVDDALAAARSIVRSGDVVLVKASRAVGLDRVATRLVTEHGGAVEEQTEDQGES